MVADEIPRYHCLTRDTAVYRIATSLAESYGYKLSDLHWEDSLYQHFAEEALDSHLNASFTQTATETPEAVKDEVPDVKDEIPDDSEMYVDYEADEETADKAISTPIPDDDDQDMLDHMD